MTTICISAKDKKIYADGCGTESNSSTDIFLSRDFNVTDQHEVDKILPTLSQVVTGTGNYQDVLNVYNSIANDSILAPPNGNTRVYVLQIVGETVRVIKYCSVEKVNIFYRIKNLFRNTATYRWETSIRNLNDNEVIFDGSGGEYAAGAYKATNDIRESIYLASQCDTMTNDNIVCFDMIGWGFE